MNNLGLWTAMVVLLTACKRGPRVWRGVPDGATLTCAYSADQEKRCVGEGRVWLCVHDYQANTYTCAPFAASPAEVQ